LKISLISFVADDAFSLDTTNSISNLDAEKKLIHELDAPVSTIKIPKT